MAKHQLVQEIFVIHLFIIKGSNESINVLLGITCCGDVAITICALKKLQAFENYSVEAVTIFLCAPIWKHGNCSAHENQSWVIPRVLCKLNMTRGRRMRANTAPESFKI